MVSERWHLQKHLDTPVVDRGFFIVEVGLCVLLVDLTGIKLSAWCMYPVFWIFLLEWKWLSPKLNSPCVHQSCQSRDGQKDIPPSEVDASSKDKILVCRESSLQSFEKGHSNFPPRRKLNLGQWWVLMVLNKLCSSSWPTSRLPTHRGETLTSRTQWHTWWKMWLLDLDGWPRVLLDLVESWASG